MSLPIWLISSPFFNTHLLWQLQFSEIFRSPSSWALISLVIPLKDSHPWPADMSLCKTSIPKLTIKGIKGIKDTWKSSMCRSGLCGFAWIHWRCEVWSAFFPNKKMGRSSFELFPNHTSTSVFCVSVRVTSMARRFKRVLQKDLVHSQQDFPGSSLALFDSCFNPRSLKHSRQCLEHLGRSNKRSNRKTASGGVTIATNFSWRFHWVCHPWMCFHVLLDPCNSKEKRGKVSWIDTHDLMKLYVRSCLFVFVCGENWPD